MALKLKTPELLPLMAGTAGHVDHGKSALVKLLTGCEMDRHPEAKLRGLTIDLGFAPLRLPGNRMLGIIDVPGHEDFIRNMVAGAASMDILMLIVAADDGIMPQTLEHLRIAKTLSTPRVMAVISKIDLVSPEKLALVRQEVKAFLAALGIVDSPIVAVSNITLDGLEEVRQTLQEMVEGIAERSDPRAFRMYVERVFSVKGYGTIVAGIPITGELQVGDEVQLLPGGSIHPVRAIQSYKFGVNTATPKVCAAINLRGLEVKDAHRGMTLAAPGIYQPTDSAIIRFTSEHEKQILKRVTRVKFHSGTNAVNASLKLLSEEKLGYRETCYAQVSFAEPAVLASGDRYIIRSLSPVDTIGGGVILSTRTHRLRRSELGLLDRLQQAASAVKEGDFFASELLAGSQAIVSNAQALNLTQCSGQTAEKRIKDAIASGLLYDLGGGALLVKERLGEVHQVLEKALNRYHQGHPNVWGMETTQACAILGIEKESFKKLIKLLSEGGGMVLRHGRVTLESFQPALSARQIELRETIIQQVLAGGINPPARGSLKDELNIPEKEMKVLLKLLKEEGLLVQMGPNLLAKEIYDDCRQKLIDLCQENDTVMLSEFRKATGASRNLSVAILESFDQAGLTRRVEDGRQLARKP